MDKKTAQFLMDGGMVKGIQIGGKWISRSEIMKVGRNEPCPCGSGKKHKKCCGGEK